MSEQAGRGRLGPLSVVARYLMAVLVVDTPATDLGDTVRAMARTVSPFFPDRPHRFSFLQ
jgi:hypothetical protein